VDPPFLSLLPPEAGHGRVGVVPPSQDSAPLFLLFSPRHRSRKTAALRAPMSRPENCPPSPRPSFLGLLHIIVLSLIKPRTLPSLSTGGSGPFRFPAGVGPRAVVPQWPLIGWEAPALQGRSLESPKSPLESTPHRAWGGSRTCNWLARAIPSPPAAAGHPLDMAVCSFKTRRFFPQAVVSHHLR